MELACSSILQLEWNLTLRQEPFEFANGPLSKAKGERVKSLETVKGCWRDQRSL